MVSCEKMKEYRDTKISELMYSKKYNDFLDYIEKELYRQIDENPFRLNVYIKVPTDINIDLIIERLTDDYGYKVSQHQVRQQEGQTIVIKL